MKAENVKIKSSKAIHGMPADRDKGKKKPTRKKKTLTNGQPET